MQPDVTNACKETARSRIKLTALTNCVRTALTVKIVLSVMRRMNPFREAIHLKMPTTA